MYWRACDIVGTGADFDRGFKRDDLSVIAAELSIKCTNKRYRRWAIYDGIMIAVWPVGATVGLAILLWRYRTKLNPKTVRVDTAEDDWAPADKDRFQRDRQRYTVAKEQLAKLKERDEDESIKGLQFLYEEYEPRCYWFSVFEITRRLFLSSALAVFYPGSMQQVVIGLLGAMFSYFVYSLFDAYINDDDDVVSSAASVQLVLIYFSALAVYTADVADQRRAEFSSEGFGIFLIVVFLRSFIIASGVVLLDIFGYASLREAAIGFHNRFLSSTSQGSSTSVDGSSSPQIIGEKQPSELGSDSVFSEDDLHGQYNVELVDRGPTATPRDNRDRLRRPGSSYDDDVTAIHPENSKSDDEDDDY